MKESNDNDDNLLVKYPDETEVRIKVVLIGESGVGKTSLISQFENGKFDADVTPTNGATFVTKRIELEEEKKGITFELWDTAGQERYRSLSQMFFKDANAALIVYDITNEKSFKEIQNYWVGFLRENGPRDIIAYLVGNKFDLSGQAVVDEKNAKEYAEEQDIVYWATSSKDPRTVSELFRDIGKQYLSPRYSNSEENKERKKREVEKININQDKNEEGQKGGCCS
jgi:small GTP-binding protein